MPEKDKFYRFLEIVPGAVSWFTLILPFALAPFFPVFVSYFILLYSLYWFFKVMNYSRHLYNGFVSMKKAMNIDWYERCLHIGNISKLTDENERNKRYKEHSDDLKEIWNFDGQVDDVLDVHDIYHVVLFALYQETIDIVAPSIEAVLNSNYPNDKIFIVLACEESAAPVSVEIAQTLKEKYKDKFYYFDYFTHPVDLPDEIRGKGPNITYAGLEFKKYFDKNEKISYENTLVTNLDADHIVHKEYLGRLTYCYILDPLRERKTYQPVALLLNNIWDVPAMNRVAAISSSYWQMIESMRPFRQRTFAAHTQSLKTLVKTNFWAKHTIVEDGHQFWRTYFAFGGHVSMVPLCVPVYQDAVLTETYLGTLKGQYLQRRRWAWGASDFAFVVASFKNHKEIPLFEKVIQSSRQFFGNYSWATASFLIAGAWIPLIFNKAFQETVLAHNVSTYSVMVMRFAWLGIFLNLFIFFSVLPPKPKRYGIFKNLGMVTQWVLSPIVAIFLSSLPALDAQTRLMFGKYLEFWSTPKIRKAEKSETS